MCCALPQPPGIRTFNIRVQTPPPTNPPPHVTVVGLWVCATAKTPSSSIFFSSLRPAFQAYFTMIVHFETHFANFAAHNIFNENNQFLEPCEKWPTFDQKNCSKATISLQRNSSEDPTFRKPARHIPTKKIVVPPGPPPRGPAQLSVKFPLK